MTEHDSQMMSGPRKIGEALTWRFHRYQDRAFDKKYGLDTSQGDESYLSQVEADSIKFAVPYEPVERYMFRRMLSGLAIRFPEYAFLDLGSGKGRALLLAAHYDFSRIIGVEFSPQLHAIAGNNVRSFVSKTGVGNNIELICQDAVEYELPHQNLVMFLYNPFFGEAMQAVVDRIARFVSHEGCDLVLLYRNPQCSDLFDNMQGLEAITSTDSFRTYRKKPQSNSPRRPGSI